MNKVLTAEELLKACLSLCDTITRSKTKSKLIPEAANLACEIEDYLEAYKNQSSVSDEERAIAFAEWILEHEWYRYYPDKTWVQDSGDREYTTAELYQIFKII